MKNGVPITRSVDFPTMNGLSAKGDANNNKVLVVVGGRGPIVEGQGRQELASAELYDPSTGAFNPTGAMTTLRGRPPAGIRKAIRRKKWSVELTWSLQ